MYEKIDQALSQGDIIRGFRSRGGLRVVRIEDQRSKLKGYGEHPHVEEALNDVDQDVAAGERDHHDVYGTLKPHYLTESGSPSSRLDDHLLGGNKFRALAKDGKVVLELFNDFSSEVETFEGASFSEALRALESKEPEQLLAATASVRAIGFQTLRHDASILSDHLIKQSSDPLLRQVTIKITALRERCDGATLPHQIAGHVASFAPAFPRALQGALATCGQNIADGYNSQNWNASLSNTSQILDIAQRWKPMLEACSRITPISLR